MTKLELFDPRTDRFQSSATEALFLSNNVETQRLVTKSGKNLVARLTVLTDDEAMIDAAVWTVLGRAPDAEEHTLLVRWVADRGLDRAKACGQLVWALLTSAEFRFNH
jgi:hypothetical protein